MWNVSIYPCLSCNDSITEPPFKLRHGCVITYHCFTWMQLLAHASIPMLIKENQAKWINGNLAWISYSLGYWLYHKDVIHFDDYCDQRNVLKIINEMPVDCIGSSFIKRYQLEPSIKDLLRIALLAWQGLPYDSKYIYRSCKDKLVEKKVIFSWSIIYGWNRTYIYI